MKNAVTIALLSGLAACSGPSDPDADPDGSIDTGNPSGEVPKIWVNEVMPGNKTGITDEHDAHPDWIELYNPNASAVDISGWWMTQDVDDVFKWQVSEGNSIPANGYLIVFADGDVDDGPDHAAFNLDRDGGDDVALFGPNAADNPLVDQVEDIQALTDDIALARIPNGSATWIVDNSPTPGVAND